MFQSLTICDNHDFDKDVSNVVKDFKSPRLELMLKARGGRKMVLANDTRWCSKQNSYESCLYNIKHMQNIIYENQELRLEDHFIFNEHVVETVLDDHFENNLIIALLNYDPICNLVNCCQMTNASIGFATEKWLTLELPVQTRETKEILRNRLQKIINKYDLAVNFLLSRYQGRSFVNNNNYVAIKNQFFQENLSPEGLNQLQDYVNQQGIFQLLFKQHYEDWKVFCRAAQPFCRKLSDLAEKLLSIPASTGDLERLFSKWALVHCKLRNRLTRKICETDHIIL